MLDLQGGGSFMKSFDSKKNLIVKSENCKRLSEDEMKKVIGSGNTQVRYISDEYIQAKILKMQINI